MGALGVNARTLLRLLEDGFWRPYEEVATELGATIAPGKALRRYDATARNRQAHHGPRMTPELSMDEKIASGRRSIATDIIVSARNRFVDVIDTEQGRMLRLRPRPDAVQTPELINSGSETINSGSCCPRCGAATGDADRHEAFHGMLDVVEDLRTVLNEEITAVMTPMLADLVKVINDAVRPVYRVNARDLPSMSEPRRPRL